MERLKFKECGQCKDWDGTIIHCINICGKPIDALKEFNKYKGLEEQGRLPELPCAVGDKVYRINKGAEEPVIPMTVFTVAILSFGGNDLEVQITCRDDGGNGENWYFNHDFGKSVFFTRKEAEAALKEFGRVKEIERLKMTC